MEKTFIKLSSLVDDQFTVKRVNGYSYKMWDNDNKKMLVAENPQKGYRKVYSVDTDKGTMDLSKSQMAQMLEEVFHDGLADVNLRTFKVKSNGETGKEIRYFFNAIPEEIAVADVQLEEAPDWAGDEEIPFN